MLDVGVYGVSDIFVDAVCVEVALLEGSRGR